MTPQIDAGGVVAGATTKIGPDETAGELEQRLAVLGATLVAHVVAALAAGPVRVLPQDKTKVTRAPKLRKEDGLIDWSTRAESIHDLVRAMQPWPAAYTTWQPRSPVPGDPLRIIVHRTKPAGGQGAPGAVLEATGDRLVVAAGENAVALVAVQIPGKKTLTTGEFLRGHRVRPGDRFGA